MNISRVASHFLVNIHTSKKSHFLTKIVRTCHDFTSWCRTAATPVTRRSSSNCITSVPRPSLPGMRHSKDATTTCYEKRRIQALAKIGQGFNGELQSNTRPRKVCHPEQIFERISLRGGRSPPAVSLGVCLLLVGLGFLWVMVVVVVSVGFVCFFRNYLRMFRVRVYQWLI